MNNIKNIRIKNHMTQETLSRVIDVNRTTVSKWETGKSMPQTKTLRQLAKVFECTVDELINQPEPA